VFNNKSSIQFRDLIKHVLMQISKKHSHELEYLKNDNREKLIFIINALMLYRFNLFEIISNDDEFILDVQRFQTRHLKSC
jgi:hypothetical protein